MFTQNIPLLHKSHFKLLTFSYLGSLERVPSFDAFIPKEPSEQTNVSKKFLTPKKEKRLCERRKETIYDIRKVPKSSKITKKVL